MQTRARLNFIFGWIGLLTFFLMASAVMAQASEEAIGQVVAVRGEVTAVDDAGQSRRLRLKNPVYRKDTIKTGDRGRIQLLFADSTLVSLGQQSELKIAEYDWQPDRQVGAMKTRIKEGTFRIMGGAITKAAPENFTTETPAATIGIRGSMYAGKATRENLTVVFQAGKGIDITNEAGTVAITKPGFGTRVTSPDSPPLPPVKFTAQDLAELNEGLQGDDEQTADDGEKTKSEDESEEGAAAEDEEGSESETAEESDSSGENTEETEENQDSTATEEDADGESQPADSAAGGEDQDNSSNDGLDSDGTLATTEETTNDGPAETTTFSEETSLAEGEDLLTTSSTTTTTTTTDTTTDSNQLLTDTTSTVQGAQVDSTQTETSTETETQVVDSRQNVSGKYFGVLTQVDTSGTASLTPWFGSLAATLNTSDGTLSGSATARDGKVFPLSFILPASGGSTYTGAYPVTGAQTVNLLGVDRSFTAEVLTSDRREFFIFRIPEGFFDNGSAEFHELGFAGIPASAVPIDGIDLYLGSLAGLDDDTSSTNSYDPSISEKMDLEVNWRNRKIVGFIKDDTATSTTSPTDTYHGNAFFFGEVDAAGRMSVRIFGSSGGDLYPEWISGSTSFGQFYGSAYQGFGMTATGGQYSLNDGSFQGSWEVAGAGFRDPVRTPEDDAAPTGIADWQGFAVGVSEDINAPNLNRQVFMSSDPSDVSLSVNRDTGTVQGSFSLDSSPASATIDGLEIGTLGSAYVLDDRFAALLGSAVNTPINGTTGLKPNGNFLVTASPEEQFSDQHLTWGYWEIAYAVDESGTTIHRHLHMPGSFWLAGQRKLETEVANAITANFTGRYAGGARGVGIDPTITYGPQMFDLTNGQSELDIYFGTGQIKGSISFDQIGFSVNSTSSISQNDFQAGINETTSGNYVGQLNGAYYGPSGTNQVEAIGGKFQGSFNDIKYLGIFGGDRVGPAPPLP